eukprot:scaffold556_cov221-Pinguiococcus_pyrenoidosus.AAC.10
MLWHARVAHLEPRGHQNTVVAAVEHLLNRVGLQVPVSESAARGPLAAQFNEDRELQEVDVAVDLVGLVGAVNGVNHVMAQAVSVNTGDPSRPSPLRRGPWRG